MEPRLVTSTMRFFECLYQPFKRLKEYRAFLNSAVDAVTQGIDPENTVETIRAVQRHPDYGNRRMVLEEIEQMLSTCEENDVCITSSTEIKPAITPTLPHSPLLTCALTDWLCTWHLAICGWLDRLSSSSSFKSSTLRTASPTSPSPLYFARRNAS